jgi:hypothetical protein
MAVIGFLDAQGHPFHRTEHQSAAFISGSRRADARSVVASPGPSLE